MNNDVAAVCQGSPFGDTRGERVKKEWNTFKLILIFEVMIDTFHSTEFILSCHLGIYMS